MLPKHHNGGLMDQSFSPDNLRRIWDGETRRGNDLLDWFPEVQRAFKTWRDRRQEVAKGLALTPDSMHLKVQPECGEKLQGLKQVADDLLADALAAASDSLIQRVENRTFRWGLRVSRSIGPRHLYKAHEGVDVYFADKQLQKNVELFLASRPSSRHQVVRGLAGTIRNDLPKVVVRADIAAFYDSIDHDLLLARLAQSGLSPTSVGLIKLLLDEYQAIVGSAKGLPAGIGLSAKLAEFFLSELDRSIRSMPNILFYGRYVDDIVIVRGDKVHGDTAPATVLTTLEESLTSLKLKLNHSKSQARALTQHGHLSKFDFLGYSFFYDGGKLRITLTNERAARLRQRVDLALDAWDKADPSNHGRRRLLLARLRFLTGNTRLTNNKRNAMVGIFFSNELLSSPDALGSLDKYLTKRLSKSTFPKEMVPLIAELSFVAGFKTRVVRRFTPEELIKIRGAWRGKA
jgi:hypothetical protein